ncbi:MAG: imidazoleglycerol-phosphate dehydratase HisB [Actinomycetota bacterium]|nr:imidazoleglycerol-phosphate dehydratase HisB [Actinomycetota bacterium]
MSERRATVERETTETKVRVALDLDGGTVQVSTGVGFFDHMLMQLGRHSHMGLDVDVQGDLDIDAHHTVEDTGITLGAALKRALGDKRGIRRYGDALVPMEESLAQIALDISGRPLLMYEGELRRGTVGAFDTELTPEFLNALCRGSEITMHVRLLRSGNAHHAIEAIFKALARALGDAVSRDERSGDEVPSTKGVI